MKARRFLSVLNRHDGRVGHLNMLHRCIHLRRLDRGDASPAKQLQHHLRLRQKLLAFLGQVNWPNIVIKQGTKTAPRQPQLELLDVLRHRRLIDAHLGGDCSSCSGLGTPHESLQPNDSKAAELGPILPLFCRHSPSTLTKAPLFQPEQNLILPMILARSCWKYRPLGSACYLRKTSNLLPFTARNSPVRTRSLITQRRRSSDGSAPRRTPRRPH